MMAIQTAALINRIRFRRRRSGFAADDVAISLVLPAVIPELTDETSSARPFCGVLLSSF
ncbi:hypothetical protein [Afipia sp. P52-10]|uniref:hypothetical protein n=1 Tax=Afipia sp. P52-10 TaxID=1429916 RepID=UPI0019D3B11F|nr:hypothetical protein [Afipia sp. P52-10]